MMKTMTWTVPCLTCGVIFLVFLLWAAVMLTGALFCLHFGLSAFCVTFAVWILTTRGKIHLSTEKAFGKYKLDQDRKDF